MANPTNNQNEEHNLSVISVDPETADAEVAPSGVFTAMLLSAQHNVRPDDAPFGAGEEEIRWTFRLDDINLGDANEGIVSDSTNITARKAGKFVRFCNAIGMDPMNFDPDEVSQIPCTIRIKQKSSKKDGETRRFANVAEIIGKR